MHLFLIGGSLLFLWFLFSGKRKCDVCGIRLRRKRHIWKIQGKKQVLCANCNRKFEGRVSREATKALLGQLDFEVEGDQVFTKPKRSRKGR